MRELEGDRKSIEIFRAGAALRPGWISGVLLRKFDCVRIVTAISMTRIFGEICCRAGSMLQSVE
jgi:hypothetical protein